MISQLLFYCLWLIGFSIVLFVLYGWDKRQATVDRRRIPENTLHILALLGGWPGAFAGQKLFRHKTRKTSFQIVFWLTVAGHLLLLAGLYYLFLAGTPA